MPGSWTQNLYHAVFATKGRAGLITPAHEDRLHAYIGGILKDLGCTPIAINGTADHVHVLARYPADLSHADMVRHVKQRSSRWLHETFAEMRAFAWQEGYGGFTVSASMLDTVAAYIRGQKDHHKAANSRAEFEEFLRKHGIDYDPKYLE